MENISNTIQNQKRNQNPMGSSPEKVSLKRFNETIAIRRR